MKIYIQVFLLTLFVPGLVLAHTQAMQTMPVKVTPRLIEKIKKIKPNSSNAHEVEQLIGKPAACVPLPPSKEAWACQWKGDLASASVANTLNIIFSAGAITNIVGIDKHNKEL